MLDYILYNPYMGGSWDIPIHNKKQFWVKIANFIEANWPSIG